MSREAQLAATREKILEAARKQFLIKGYADTSTRDIATAAGITQPALYHHFADKELIFVQVIETVGGELAANMNQILDANKGDGLEILTDMSAAMVAIHPRDAFSLIHGSFQYLRPENQAQLGRLFAQDYLQPIIRFFKSDKVVLRDGVDPATAANFYLTSLAPLFAKFHQLGGANLSQREHIQVLLRLILFGVAEK
ncbi:MULTISPECIES: TetR/AcrR family transcriptional regulator [Furfurilactobacillus]|uniref:TetR family transcriptional regulator n=1 Tax=Furfurilactobacillus rossiae TaxID=231049 RepID=A0A7C9NP06_9LACO|nr:TetR/AcrR family transcriptional regulator [Furfurilactobacillus milii]MYV04711.1 TetR family transcriptional regulator [Furfurilactobacillus milii]